MNFTKANITPNTAPVEFSKRGFRKLAHVNRMLRNQFTRAFILRHEVSWYLSSQEQAGAVFDTQCQELHYDEQIWLLVQKVQGVWYIIDVWLYKSVVCSVYMFFRKHIKQYGYGTILRMLNSRQNYSFKLSYVLGIL